ncbi:hypothetical protein BDN72DRAFT_833536 [Pluteus cervinus]|uniref:Uncharacterized protein n=1 Tax=Pluteus cervinus TaxID=181527 RepID=A0ACD3BB55_9AGAR|nr:hypothetical protein BDN72DRAFT_833536 [Pluteus cervinus]
MATKQLPPEVWGRVFEYTCVDDGTMGRSLSLVSRSFHHASAPYKYQSIAIKPWHLKHILKFFQVLRKAPPMQRRVRYLCLGNNGRIISDGWSTESEDEDDLYYDDEADPDSDGDEESVDSEGSQDTESIPFTEEELRDLLQDEGSFKSSEAADKSSQIRGDDCHDYCDSLARIDTLMTRLDILILDVIHAILELCSKSILSLSVSVKNFVKFGVGHAFLFPTIGLPLLKELTWIIPIHHAPRRCFNDVAWDEPDLPSRDQPVLFPSLKRFHGDFPTGEAHRLWIEHCCPKLRYLRTNFQRDIFERSAKKALSHSIGDAPSGSSLCTPVRISMHTPTSVQLHLIDVEVPLTGRYELRTSENYEDICDEFGVGSKCDFDSRVVITAKRKDNWKMTETDWEDRKLGKLGKPGFRWKHWASDDRSSKEADDVESSVQYIQE